jgi:hypothetical protein
VPATARAGEGRQAETVDGGVGERGERRRGHRPEGGGPDGQRQLPATAGRLGQVDGGVAGLQVGGGAPAEEQHAEKEEGHPPRDRRDDHEPGADRPDEVRQHEAGAATTGVHQRGDRHRKERAADHGGALRQARDAGAAQSGGEQRADGDGDGDADPAEDLRAEEQPQGTPLHDRWIVIVRADDDAVRCDGGRDDASPPVRFPGTTSPVRLPPCDGVRG